MTLPHTVKAGEIAAWRGWIVLGNEGVIRSVYMTNIIWLPGQPLRSNAPPLASDFVDHRRGIHAWKEPTDYLTVFDDCQMAVASHCRLLTGWVALWGEVIETELGYVAEYAQPLRFDVLAASGPYGNDHAMLEKLRGLYLGNKTKEG